jgi:glutamyl-tRNA synthetase
MPVKAYHFDDAVLGPDQGVGPSQVQDFVIRKSDGMPTYHFAVVIDDAEMGVTHVLRGQEHLLNTVNHIALQEALGYPRPTYAHLPVILNTDGSKMSKRDRDKKIRHHAVMWTRNAKSDAAGLAAAAGLPAERIAEWLDNDGMQLDATEQQAVMKVVKLKPSDLPEVLVHDFRKNGYLPEVLLNFLALLGWNPGGDKEQMSMDELVQLFTVENIGKSNARFNRDKLLAFNTDACAKAPLTRLVAGLRKALTRRPVEDGAAEKAADAIEAELRSAGVTEVPSSRIGALAMEQLRGIDQIAYIRFASVYQSFEDLEALKREVDSLYAERGSGSLVK